MEFLVIGLAVVLAVAGAIAQHRAAAKRRLTMAALAQRAGCGSW